ncbi:hypothetical protein PYCC9005_002311 [Savitreella phatthalungensis]
MAKSSRSQQQAEGNERKRNFRNGPARDKQSNTRDYDVEGDGSGSGRSRTERAVAVAALRQSASAGVVFGGGVGKRGNHSAKQKKRKQEMLARAEQFTDKIAKKTVEYNMSQKNLKQRRQDWNTVNENAFNVLVEAVEAQPEVPNE